MTYARSHTVSPNGGTYHVHSRCVRRAWLCGRDSFTGRNFDHRRDWIEQRIHWLATIFPVSIHAYAIMSNHYHIVLSVEADACRALSDEEIVSRWLKLCPGRRTRSDDTPAQLRRDALLASEETISSLRARLVSLSWFMRFINEPLARRANKEDECTGRFWEGRFKSQRLLDENSVLACMAYVDLNPVRAGIATRITECRLTSIHHRLAHRKEHPTMSPIGTCASSMFSAIDVYEYIELLDWVTKAQQHVRPGKLMDLPTPLKSSIVNPDIWLDYYFPKPGYWRRAVGSIEKLRRFAEEIGQRWIQHSRRLAT